MIAFLLRLRRDDTVIIGDGSIGQEEDDMVQRVSNDARVKFNIVTVVGVSQIEGGKVQVDGWANHFRGSADLTDVGQNYLVFNKFIKDYCM